MRVGATIALGVALSGCTGLNYVVANYGGVHTQYFTASNGALYRIFDKPEESRLMITPSLTNAAIHGVAKDATFGLVRPMSAEAPFRQAAAEFLQSEGRSCTIDGVKIIFDPQAEVKYRCEIASVAPQVGGPLPEPTRSAPL
jgi:hypothetical protein